MSIATMVDSVVVMLDTTLVAVLVMTFWIPPTSLERRDWISPVRVAVKKRSDMA